MGKLRAKFMIVFAFGERGEEWFWGGVQRDFNFIRNLE